MIHSLLHVLGRCFRQPKSQAGGRVRSRLVLECLQERIVPSTSPVSVNSAHQLVILGTDDNDVVQVSEATDTLQIDYNGQAFSFATQDVKMILFRGGAGDDQFSNSSSLRVVAIGGAGNDDLSGGSGNDKLLGGAGDDILRGGDGDDVIQGGNGDDSIDGGAGDDDLQGENGIDDIAGDDGNDVIRAGNGADNVHGGLGDDRLFADNGHDSLYGDDGNDRLRGGNGRDDLHGGTGDDILKGEAGDDSLNGDLGEDFNDGGAGRDSAFNLSDDSSKGCETKHQHHDDELYAQLTGSGSAVGQAKFQNEIEHGVTQNKLELQITGGPVDQTFDIVIDGSVVGQVTTNSLGNASVELRGSSLQVVSGSTLTVRDASSNVLVSGAFGFETEDEDSEITLVASMSGAGAVLGSGKFESGHDNGTAPTEFEVKIKNGPVSQTLNVVVDGNTVGQIATGDSGNGELDITSPAFAVQVGSTLEVKDLLDNVILAGVFQSA